MRKIWNLPFVEFKPFQEIQERRPVVLITSSPAWEVVRGQLEQLVFLAQIEPLEATTAHWNELLNQIDLETEEMQQTVVYAVGGGLVVDAAKYAAVKLDLPLICLPTALSVDAFLTCASGIRQDGCVAYIETKVPETMIVDGGN